MKIWIMVAVVAVLAIVGIVAVNALQSENSDLSGLEQGSGEISCSTCGNSCTAGSNCGLESCGARNGGTCGCNG